MLVTESPYLGDFLDQLEFDTIYHEHLFYYSITALNSLFNRHGLVIEDVEHLAIHGGTLRLTVRSDRVGTSGPAVVALLQDERESEESTIRARTPALGIECALSVMN